MDRINRNEPPHWQDLSGWQKVGTSFVCALVGLLTLGLGVKWAYNWCLRRCVPISEAGESVRQRADSVSSVASSTFSFQNRGALFTEEKRAMLERWGEDGKLCLQAWRDVQGMDRDEVRKALARCALDDTLHSLPVVSDEYIEKLSREVQGLLFTPGREEGRKFGEVFQQAVEATNHYFESAQKNGPQFYDNIDRIKKSISILHPKDDEDKIRLGVVQEALTRIEGFRNASWTGYSCLQLDILLSIIQRSTREISEAVPAVVAWATEFREVVIAQRVVEAGDINVMRDDIERFVQWVNKKDFEASYQRVSDVLDAAVQCRYGEYEDEEESYQWRGPHQISENSEATEELAREIVDHYDLELLTVGLPPAYADEFRQALCDSFFDPKIHSLHEAVQYAARLIAERGEKTWHIPDEINALKKRLLRAEGVNNVGRLLDESLEDPGQLWYASSALRTLVRESQGQQKEELLACCHTCCLLEETMAELILRWIELPVQHCLQLHPEDISIQKMCDEVVGSQAVVVEKTEIEPPKVEWSPTIGIAYEQCQAALQQGIDIQDPEQKIHRVFITYVLQNSPLKDVAPDQGESASVLRYYLVTQCKEQLSCQEVLQRAVEATINDLESTKKVTNKWLQEIKDQVSLCKEMYIDDESGNMYFRMAMMHFVDLVDGLVTGGVEVLVERYELFLKPLLIDMQLELSQYEEHKLFVEKLTELQDRLDYIVWAHTPEVEEELKALSVGPGAMQTYYTAAKQKLGE